MKRKSKRKGELPVASSEDIEFSGALADEADLEALERAKQADERAKNAKFPRH